MKILKFRIARVEKNSDPLLPARIKILDTALTRSIKSDEMLHEFYYFIFIKIRIIYGGYRTAEMRKYRCMYDRRYDETQSTRDIRLRRFKSTFE